MISIINGTVSDAGLAIILNSLHIVATKNTKVVFRETKIGLFPSLGLCRDLSNLLNVGPALGMYLTMTGRILEGRDVLLFGIATNFIEESRIVDLNYAFETLIKFTS